MSLNEEIKRLTDKMSEDAKDSIEYTKALVDFINEQIIEHAKKSERPAHTYLASALSIATCTLDDAAGFCLRSGVVPEGATNINGSSTELDYFKVLAEECVKTASIKEQLKEEMLKASESKAGGSVKPEGKSDFLWEQPSDGVVH